MNPITLFLAIASALVGLTLGKTVDIFLAPPFLVAAVIIALSLKMANAWQKFVVLRAGKLQGVKGPGLFLIFPIIDNVVAVIDERIQTTAFNAEQALTKDTVPVNVDAIIFWHVQLFSGTSMMRAKRHWKSPTIGRPSTASRRPRSVK
jgi:regulator of protease activity HflC (stomatin/prohibitin superfamily)